MRDEDVAIVGMAGRFPGAADLDRFWENLSEGIESIRPLSDDELLAAGVRRRDLQDPEYVKVCPVLDDIDKFDAAFFGISPREASVMDPAHRFFLEVVWEALEHSGNTGYHEEGTVAVFAASGAPYYLMDNVRTNSNLMAELGEFLARHSANDMNFLATRASYELDLRGPSVNVQTACSSALAAIHQARVALLRKECDLALAGASTIILPMGHGYKYKEGEILSPDGHCRPFDHRSAGTVFGSGTGCFVLKRLQDALDAGDTIYALVKGSAVNNDGALKVGYLAPGVERQVDVVRDALSSADVPAESISYVETHGTGTSVGDPIELTALAEALATTTKQKQFCGVGSVKSNIGHLGEAAACASLAKVVLGFKHGQIPATLGFEKPNPQLSLEEGPLYVVDRLTEWKKVDGPRRCGITALGAGGTNVHVILEEPPPALPGEGERPIQLLTLSAKSRPALDRQCERLAAYLAGKPDLDLADAAYTLAVGRRDLDYRRVLTASSVSEAVTRLTSADPKILSTAVADVSSPGLVFTFPGGGAQYAGMGRDLYELDPVYREAMDECLESIDQVLDIDLRELLFARGEEQRAATKKLERPSLSLPALFATEYSLAKMFESWGLEPVAMIGHSMGEYVAACLAEVFSVADGIRLVAIRGRLFETTPPGSMVAVSLSEEDVRAKMPEGLSIAAVNAPELCVASGPSELVEELKRRLTDDDVDWTAIHIEVAAHSSMLESILEEFRSFCRGIPFQAPSRPIASNLTGKWLTAEQATDPEYWVQHLRNTVRFADCVETVLARGSHVFLEIGPGRTLTSLANAQKTKVSHCVNSIRHVKEEANDLEYALMTMGKIWASGAAVDWTAFYEEQLRNRIALPTYPFEKTSYFVEPGSRSTAADAELVKRENIDEWFYAPTWSPSVSMPGESSEANWLLVGDDEAWTESLAQDLRSAGGRVVVTASYGKALRRVSREAWKFDPENPSHISEILEVLDSEGTLPQHTVFTAGLRSEGPERWKGLLTSIRGRLTSVDEGKTSPDGDPDSFVDYLCLVHLAKALLSNACDQGRISVVTSHAFAMGNEVVQPRRRLLAGPTRVIPREVPELRTRFIDADHSTDNQAIVLELLAGGDDAVVLLRGRGRWVQSLTPLNVPAPVQVDDESTVKLEAIPGDSVVAITGGLGGIGLVVAKHLAQKPGIRLALLSRSTVPHHSKWAELIASDDTPSSLKRRLSSLLEIEELGARVMCVQVDVTNLSSVERAAEAIAQKWEPVRTLIHAAGVFDDGPFQTKSDESLLRVLRPKVVGTDHLERVFGDELQLFVLFSSVASFLGLPGQIDYSAANAYLDAIAEKRAHSSPGRTLVVNWNAWRDVGMVAEEVASHEPLRPTGCQHPWLVTEQSRERSTSYLLEVNAERDWLLSEHKIRGGLALIPGTGFVELLRAAYSEKFASTSVEMSEVRFMAPFQVSEGETRRLQVEVSEHGDVASVTVVSVPERVEHASAQIKGLEDAPPNAIDLQSVRDRCGKQGSVREGGFLDQDFVQFGARWGNIKSIQSEGAEALIDLELAESFASDVPTLAYHPALMDMATGAAQHLIPGFDQTIDFYVPFAYERVRIFGPLTRRCHSHVRLDPASQGDIAIFDVTVTDSTGRVLIDISGFTMKRAQKDAAIVQSEVARSETAGKKVLESLLREAIAPDEGIAALERALSHPRLNQAIISSVDVNLWLKQLSDTGTSDEQDATDAGGSFSRPDLGTEYVAPSNSVEECLAAMWSKLLGVGDPGVLDDFFELGGDSLVAVRFFARVKKQLGVSLPISTLFRAPTIRTLAELLVEQGVEVEEGKRVEDPARKKFVPYSALASSKKPRSIDLPPGLHRPEWKRTDSLARVSEQDSARCWLVFVDDIGLARLLKQSLSSFGQTVVFVRPGDGYSRSSSTEYVVAPEKGTETYELLFRDLLKDGNVPTDVLHMWLVTKDESFRRGSNFFHRTQEQGCYSLLAMAQTIADAELDAPMNVTCVTSGLSTAQAETTRTVHDSKAMVHGILECIPAELPRIRTRQIDLDIGQGGGDWDLGKQIADTFKSSTSEELALQGLARALLAEVLAPSPPGLVLLSQTQRYIRGWAPLGENSTVRLPRTGSRGTYCLLGSPTPLGLDMLARLARNEGETIIVWLREQLPAKPDEDEERKQTALALSQTGATVVVEDCDLTNLESVVAAIRRNIRPESELVGAVLCGRPPSRELMQLFEPGEAEEELSSQVQSAQILTSSMRDLAPEAFVVLVGHEHGRMVVDGESARRAGAAFLASHAEKCRMAGQRVFCLWEEGLADEGEARWDESLSANIVSRLLDKNGSPQTLWALASRPLVVATLPVSEGHAPPSVLPSRQGSDMEKILVPLFQEAVGDSSLHAQSPLSDFHASRLSAARLLTHIKNHYRLQKSVSELMRYETAAQLAALMENRVEEEVAKSAFRHLVPMHPSQPGNGTPFFLVAGMFGNILNLRHLGRLLGADREVYGVQARGLYGDEKPHRRIEDMAATYLEEISQVVPDGPYLLGGFSGGGLVAFEMAKRLRAAGKDVPVVIMLDTPLPQRPELTYRDRIAMQRIRLQREGVKYIGQWAKNRVSWELELVRRRFHEIDETYSPGEFKYDAIQDAFLEAAASYQVGTYAGRVLLYRPALDKAYEVAPGRFMNSSRELVLEDQGWSPYVAEIEVREVPGDHDHMVLEPEVRVLASLMRRRLAEIDSSSGPGSTLDGSDTDAGQKTNVRMLDSLAAK